MSFIENALWWWNWRRRWRIAARKDIRNESGSDAARAELARRLSRHANGSLNAHPLTTQNKSPMACWTRAKRLTGRSNGMDAERISQRAFELHEGCSMPLIASFHTQKARREHEKKYPLTRYRHATLS